MKLIIKCDWCAKKVERFPSQVKTKNFCSRACLGAYNSKITNPEGYQYRDFSKNSERMTKINKELNPTRMREETKEKIRNAHLGKGEGKSYKKVHGRHEHRVIAEKKLGRALKKGEVVHHIDEDINNNNLDNLMVFPSQKEHAAHHAKINKLRGGDLHEV